MIKGLLGMKLTTSNLNKLSGIWGIKRNWLKLEFIDNIFRKKIIKIIKLGK